MNKHQERRIVALLEHYRHTQKDADSKGTAYAIENILNNQQTGKVIAGTARKVFGIIEALAERYPDMPVKMWIEQDGNADDDHGIAFIEEEGRDNDHLLEALNRLFWKLYLPPDKSVNSYAEYIAAEIRDGGHQIFWDSNIEKFVEGK